MIVERIYQWAKSQPDRLAVIWNDVSLSYLSYSNAIQLACDFFQRENLPVGSNAIILVHSLSDAWIIVMAWGFGIAMLLHLVLIVMLAFVAGH